MYYNRFPFLIKSSAGYDSDAQAYFTNASISADATVKGHYNTWVLAAKANGYYSKLKVFRPYLTNNATQNSYNAINTALHQLNYYGTLTHSATTGMTGDGSTGYADYAIDGTPFAEGGDELGLCAGVWIKASGTGTVDSYFLDDLGSIAIVDSNSPQQIMILGVEGYYPTVSRFSTGFHFINTHPTDATTFQINGSDVYTGAESPAYTDYFSTISIFNYLDTYYSNASITCDFLGYGLTDAERASFYSDLSTLQTNLGR